RWLANPSAGSAPLLRCHLHLRFVDRTEAWQDEPVCRRGWQAIPDRWRSCSLFTLWREEVRLEAVLRKEWFHPPIGATVARLAIGNWCHWHSEIPPEEYGPLSNSAVPTKDEQAGQYTCHLIRGCAEPHLRKAGSRAVSRQAGCR